MCSGRRGPIAERRASEDAPGSTSDADADVNSAIGDASRETAAGGSDAGADSGLGVAINTTALAVETDVTVAVTTDLTA